MNWKAKLPKELPDSGNVHFVFAVKTETGYRTELTGTADGKKIMDAYQIIMGIGKHKDGEHDGDSQPREACAECKNPPGVHAAHCSNG